MAFLLTAIGVYGWGLWGRERLVETPIATSTIRQSEAVAPDGTTSAAAQLRAIEGSLTDRSNVAAALRSVEGKRPPDSASSFDERVDAVRQQIAVRAAAGSLPRSAEISVTCRSGDATLAALLANTLAAHYAAGASKGWQQRLNAAVAAASEAVREMRTTLDRAQADLDVLLAREAAQATKPIPIVAPPAVETADLLPLGRQLERLKLRRASLLLVRTEAHPDVQELDEQIAALQAKLNSPGSAAEAWQPIAPPATELALPMPPSTSVVDIHERESLEQAVEEARLNYDRAVLHKTFCRTLLQRAPRVTTEFAEALPTRAAAPAGIPWPLAVVSLAAGVLVALLVGLLSGRKRVSPTIDSVIGLELNLKVPVVAVVPASELA